MKSLLVIIFLSVVLVGYSQNTTTDNTQSTTSSADKIIDFAKTFLGVPYVYGGSSPAGFDCSGFIQYVFKEFGYSFARTASAQSLLGYDVTLNELEPGDLMYFKGRNVKSTSIGHVGMVTSVTEGKITFIHAAGKSVKMETFNNNSYYVPRFVKARRAL